MNNVSNSFFQTNFTPKLHLGLMVSADDLNSRSYSQLALRIKYHDNPKSINFNMPNLLMLAKNKKEKRKLQTSVCI
jgi:hypothetical protein